MTWARAVGLSALALTAACGGEPTVAVVPAARIESQPRPDAWRRRLEAAQLSGFVLVPAEGAKHTSIEAARGRTHETPRDESRKRETSREGDVGEVVVHRVFADHGDVVEVQPIERREGDHCHHGSYESVERLTVRGFVKKRALEPILAADVVVRGPDGTAYEVRRGLRVVVEGEDRFGIGEGLRLPLPDASELSLSYDGPIRRFERPYHAYGWGSTEREPEPTFVLGHAVLSVGEQRFLGRDIAEGSDLFIAREATGEGEQRRVTLQAGCIAIIADVPVDAIREGYERRGMGMGMGGLGVGGGFRSAAPPPKEHYAPAGTPLFWKDGAGAAGSLATAFRSYPLTEAACMRVAQGFVGDPEVCLAASAVVRDCRAACESEGLCAVDAERCVAATAKHCRESSECELSGACTLRDGHCVAASDDDCAHSLQCKYEPHACMAHEERCVVTPNPDCENRPGCKSEGRCVANELGACVAADDAHCAASAECARAGKCGEYGGTCDPTEDGHCRGSSLCAEEGRCFEKNRECVVGAAADCEKSTACKERGDCSLLYHRAPGGLLAREVPEEVPHCGPASDDDCSRAAQCKGRCTVVERWGMSRCDFSH